MSLRQNENAKRLPSLSLSAETNHPSQLLLSPLAKTHLPSEHDVIAAPLPPSLPPSPAPLQLPPPHPHVATGHAVCPYSLPDGGSPPLRLLAPDPQHVCLRASWPSTTKLKLRMRISGNHHLISDRSAELMTWMGHVTPRTVPTHFSSSSLLQPTKKRLTSRFQLYDGPTSISRYPFRLRPSTARRAPWHGSVRPGV